MILLRFGLFLLLSCFATAILAFLMHHQSLCGAVFEDVDSPWEETKRLAVCGLAAGVTAGLAFLILRYFVEGNGHWSPRWRSRSVFAVYALMLVAAVCSLATLLSFARLAFGGIFHFTARLVNRMWPTWAESATIGGSLGLAVGGLAFLAYRFAGMPMSTTASFAAGAVIIDVWLGALLLRL